MAAFNLLLQIKHVSTFARYRGAASLINPPFSTSCILTDISAHAVEPKRKLRFFSSINEEYDEPEEIYRGPFSSMLRNIKLISITSCAATLLSAPVLAAFGREEIPIAGRVALAATGPYLCRVIKRHLIITNISLSHWELHDWNGVLPC